MTIQNPLLEAPVNYEPVQAFRFAGPDQTVNFSTLATTAAAAFSTEIIRVVTNVTCWAKIGRSDVATTAATGTLRLVADTPEVFAVKIGDKMSFVQAASAGAAYVTEIG